MFRIFIIVFAAVTSAADGLSTLAQQQAFSLIRLKMSLNLTLDWSAAPRDCIYNATNVLGMALSLRVNSNFSFLCCWTRVTCCLGLPCSSRIKQPYAECGCEPGAIASLDLSDMALSSDFSSLLSALGPLNTTLSFIDLSGNLISGLITSLISSFTRLSSLSLARNQLTGSLGEDLLTLSPLKDLDLSFNQLKGSVPRSLCKAGSISQTSPLINLDLSHNQLSGSFDVLFCISMESIDLSSNNFTGLGGGTAEWFVGYTNLRSVSISNNPMIRATIPSISSNQLQSLSASSCGLIGSLPSSIFGKLLSSLDLSNNSLSGDLPLSIVDSVISFIDLSDNPFMNTSLPLPSYMTLSNDLAPYKGGLLCPRLLLNRTNSLSLITTQIDPSFFQLLGCLSSSSEAPLPWIETNRIWVIIVSSVIGLVILSLAIITSLWLVRKKLIQKAIDLKQSLPEPQSGSVMSFVVTDIEGYSSLMRSKPAMMRDALMTHNNLMRDSKWQHYGSIVDQEGDSFILVFHKAFDAVAFALCAQSSLSEAQWPEGLLDPHLSPLRPTTPRSLSPASLMRVGRALMRSLKSGSSGHPGAQVKLPSFSISRGALEHPAVSKLKGNTDNISPRDSPPPRSSPRSTAAIEVVSIDLVLAPASAALDGLRVRMGVATGLVDMGSSLKSNTILSLAKEISDAAQGGQVLMDQATFAKVKERARELGFIEESSHLASTHCNTLCFPAPLARQDALLLDMGRFVCKREGHGEGQDSETLQLFQALSPKLSTRGAFFGEAMMPSIKWKVLARGIFSAPGLSSAPGPFFSATVSPSQVSIIFCSIENQQETSRTQREEAAAVHLLITQVMEGEVMRLAGGYLCRAQPHSYLLVFSDPSLAVSFCLRVQAALKQIPWPAAGGCPVINFGLAKGSPDCILISHDGRADYHGHSVNTAARILDVAARGGMIVCDSSFASEAFQSMRVRERVRVMEGLLGTGDAGIDFRVNAWRLGGYVFKGSEEVKELVVISTDATAPCLHPSGGKGKKVQSQEGLFESYDMI